MKAVLRSDVLLLVVFIVHKCLSCSDPPCANSSIQDRVNSLTHANFTSERPRVRKLATFAQTMANIIKDTNAEQAQRILRESVSSANDAKESKDAKEVVLPTFPIPSSSSSMSSTYKVLKAADSVLLSLLGTQAVSTKGVLATTLLAKLIKKFLENRNFQNANRRISRRSGRSYLDSEAIILFILGLGIGSIMGLGSVLLPLGFYGGYGGGYGAIPVNTQVTGRKRREIGETTEIRLQQIGKTLMKALEKYAENK